MPADLADRPGGDGHRGGRPLRLDERGAAGGGALEPARAGRPGEAAGHLRRRHVRQRRGGRRPGPPGARPPPADRARSSSTASTPAGRPTSPAATCSDSPRRADTWAPPARRSCSCPTATRTPASPTRRRSAASRPPRATSASPAARSASAPATTRSCSTRSPRPATAATASPSRRTMPPPSWARRPATCSASRSSTRSCASSRPIRTCSEASAPCTTSRAGSRPMRWRQGHRHPAGRPVLRRVARAARALRRARHRRARPAHARRVHHRLRDAAGPDRADDHVADVGQRRPGGRGRRSHPRPDRHHGPAARGGDQRQARGPGGPRPRRLRDGVAPDEGAGRSGCAGRSRASRTRHRTRPS